MSKSETTAIAQLKRLAIEAAREAPDPRAKRCWLRHDWTMWAPVRPNSIFQRRRCMRCGLTKEGIV